MKQVVIIPTINPSAGITELVDQLKEQGFERIIVVDDGSDSDWSTVFDYLSDAGCVVVHHGKNLGKGAAIKTGIQTMRKTWPDAPAFVTVDGDGQHLPKDVYRVAIASQNNPGCVVLGIRNLRERNVPPRSKLGNAFSSLYFKLDTGVKCPDTQTGLRVVPASLFSVAQSCDGDRYEYEMNFLTMVARGGVSLLMIPITTVYEDGNAGSHFDTLRDSYRIYRSFFRFAGASLICAVADLGLFALGTAVFSAAFSAVIAVAVATVVARLASGTLNFTLNRFWSFRADEGRTHVQAQRYLVLFLAQMLMSATLVAFVSLVLPALLAKIIVDSCLFVFSYFVQRNWVFAGEKDMRAQQALPLTTAATKGAGFNAASGIN
ncbi:MAG: glycosyltransferase [Tractidigestivibacter sp.]|jgi:glycosyltransferase involved in cell wall biosynthesis|uniref:glycosyltransferase n=1 Tax=Tractidigestivibacter sp. TaxID=2847320 RepID=UPI003D8B99ED